MIYRLLPLLFVLLLGACGRRGAAPTVQSQPPRNILLIAVDDLRPEFGAAGTAQMHTPTLDALAARGVYFERAYCNAAVCGASRASLLTGTRPLLNRFRHYYTQVQVEAPELTTLPAQLKDHGYYTAAIGKIFHEPWDMERAAWTVPPHTYGTPQLPYPPHSAGGWMNYVGAESKKLIATHGKALPYEALDTADTAYFDGLYAREAVSRLRELAGGDRPFFLALGLLKPHLPFTPPQKYWDLYPPESIELPATYNELPENCPRQLANFNWGELRGGYHGVPRQGPVSDEMARELIRGYRASVSFIDAQLGLVLQALKDNGLADNTLVVLWGDHGWNLGEHGFWCKHIPLETAMRTTLIIDGPGVVPDRSQAVVELVDLYPTLLDFSGIAAPNSHALAGESLLPLVYGQRDTLGENYAISGYGPATTLVGPRYNYTEYYTTEGELTERMLFDRRNDPRETRNLVELPEHAATAERLGEQLRARLPEAFFEVPAPSYPGRQ